MPFPVTVLPELLYLAGLLPRLDAMKNDRKKLPAPTGSHGNGGHLGFLKEYLACNVL